MPYSDPEEKNRAARRWYAQHREQVIAAVARRKRTLYAGECRHCGGPTVGQSRNDIPEFCGKTACKSAQRKGKPIMRKPRAPIRQAVQQGEEHR